MLEQTWSKKRGMQQYLANFLQVSQFFQTAMTHFVKTTTWSLLGGLSSFATNSLGGLTFARFKEPTSQRSSTQKSPFKEMMGVQPNHIFLVWIDQKN